MTAPCTRRTVLVVDDEPDLVEMIAFGLESLGYEVDTATDGGSAIALARTRRYDVAMTDLQMPDGGGIATMAALKEAQPGLPVMIITAYAGEGVLSDCRRRGAACCMLKPFTNDELHAAIGVVLSSA